jgi:hypothetical protein
MNSLELMKKTKQKQFDLTTQDLNKLKLSPRELKLKSTNKERYTLAHRSSPKPKVTMVDEPVLKRIIPWEDWKIKPEIDFEKELETSNQPKQHKRTLIRVQKTPLKPEIVQEPKNQKIDKSASLNLNASAWDSVLQGLEHLNHVLDTNLHSETTSVPLLTREPNELMDRAQNVLAMTTKFILKVSCGIDLFYA